LQTVWIQIHSSVAVNHYFVMTIDELAKHKTLTLEQKASVWHHKKRK